MAIEVEATSEARTLSKRRKAMFSEVRGSISPACNLSIIFQGTGCVGSSSDLDNITEVNRTIALVVVISTPALNAEVIF
jgi:hypothetical protein